MYQVPVWLVGKAPERARHGHSQPPVMFIRVPMAKEHTQPLDQARRGDAVAASTTNKENTRAAMCDLTGHATSAGVLVGARTAG